MEPSSLEEKIGVAIKLGLKVDSEGRISDAEGVIAELNMVMDQTLHPNE